MRMIEKEKELAKLMIAIDVLIYDISKECPNLDDPEN